MTWLTTWMIDSDFATFMAQVDDIHQQAVEIEKVAHALDEYSRHLGNFEGAKIKSMSSCSNPYHRNQAGEKDQYHGNHDNEKRHLILITPTSSTPFICLDRYLLTTSLYIFIHPSTYYKLFTLQHEEPMR